jgi:C4-dicarboxylate-specific signal transduction histidine kinase
MTIGRVKVRRFFELLAIATPIAKGGDLGLAPAVAERVITLCGGAVHVENLTPPGVRFVVQLKAGGRHDPR